MYLKQKSNSETIENGQNVKITGYQRVKIVNLQIIGRKLNQSSHSKNTTDNSSNLQFRVLGSIHETAKSKKKVKPIH